MVDYSLNSTVLSNMHTSLATELFWSTELTEVWLKLCPWPIIIVCDCSDLAHMFPNRKEMCFFIYYDTIKKQLSKV